MKIATFGLDIQPGKVKYTNEAFEKLVKKFSPKKITPYTVEFIGESFEKADAIVFDSNKKLDFIFIDLEKIETRLTRTSDEAERALLTKAQGMLEKETLLCDAQFSEEEKAFLKVLAPFSFKPCVDKENSQDVNALIEDVLKKAEILLFFTAGEKEVHAWEVKKGSSILEAAGKIHSDLARGFIKGEVIRSADLDKFFNMAEARAKGLAKAVERDYLMEAGDIIEIKFSV
ncbi:MAG: DUF933 domain-containing protein [Candidatus Omnitrophica bacterium]|nr:DUF933 domain-containing protein [Candidatus Omnitrophota bacterium]